jgi:hypothetical protein
LFEVVGLAILVNSSAYKFGLEIVVQSVEIKMIEVIDVVVALCVGIWGDL